MLRKTLITSGVFVFDVPAAVAVVVDVVGDGAGIVIIVDVIAILVVALFFLVIVAVFVASTTGFGLITSSVLSSVVFPSVSSPSSLRSVTPPGFPVLLAFLLLQLFFG